MTLINLSKLKNFLSLWELMKFQLCLKNRDEAPYKSDTFTMLGYCLEYYNDNPYITEFLKKTYSPEQIVSFQEPMEREVAETVISLDEKEEECEEQKEDLPSNDSNSLSLTLFDCPSCLPKENEVYVPMDSLEIFPMNETCGNDYATIIYPCCWGYTIRGYP